MELKQKDSKTCPFVEMQSKETPAVLTLWQEKMEAGNLTTDDFINFWKENVPKFFSTNNCDCLGLDKHKAVAQQVMFDVLGEFIFGGKADHVLADISRLSKPPSVCGRVFKGGEPTYSCRDCGMDTTCVLCVKCFEQSKHRNHKYKMGTSSGGGCCDCGDKEAWKQDVYCDYHICGTLVDTESSPVLPWDIAARTHIVLDAVLWYCNRLLSLEHTPRLPSYLLQDTESSSDYIDCDTRGQPDVYCTVLYNDETHTFEQVISTLTRVLKIPQPQAAAYVTDIDAKGRKVVAISSFQQCTEMKMDIQRYTSRHNASALKVHVVNCLVIDHQNHALGLMDWLEQFLTSCEGFRVIFTEIVQKCRTPELSILESIMQRDIQLWKDARVKWHRLFISGMLLEYENKKALATVFTKNYGTIMKDFIYDDHEHALSITSLSVQLFTVPTLAHYLIAQKDVLFILMNTFISECTRKCNDDMRLEFKRNATNAAFKRAQIILCDVKYLLSVTPKEWNDQLRLGFLQGNLLILKLLSFMQDMDSVVRQVGQHMEYEPEWESAFNLHIKLAQVIPLVLEWCSSDFVVFVKTYRATLSKLYDALGSDAKVPGHTCTLAKHSASCLIYDVSSDPVSIHLPISRFLAGLHLSLERFGLYYNHALFSIPNKPTPQQMIEPVLRTQAMIAQVNAGMWRRNGYALLNQLYFFHNVKCRTEMLDRDIVLLQVGATLIESNEFLIHMIHKFNLLNWADDGFEDISLRSPEEDSMRQTINLVEEFLGLLITIIGERHMPGVICKSWEEAAEDRLKKEIIQQLCIKPMAHSELNKTLPDDIHHETGLEKVISELADFKKPAQLSGKGVYELKQQYFSEFNVFYYHYTKEECSKADESQRNRRKAAGELECCPPPELPPLNDSFYMLPNLLQCDVMLHIMQIVMMRSCSLRARSFSETQLHKVLHLIGYALHEESSGRYQHLQFTSKARGFLTFLEELEKSPRVESHRDLITWTVNKFRQVSKSHADTDQRTQPLPSNDKEKERRAKLAAQKREKIMAQMAIAQRVFMKQNAKFLNKTEVENIDMQVQSSSIIEEPGPAPSTSMDICADDIHVCLGINQTSRTIDNPTYCCILCQENGSVSKDGPALVLCAFVQNSTVLFRNNTQTGVISDGEDTLLLSSSLGTTPHTGTCGHVMHYQCWQKYFNSVVLKETRRPYRLRQPASYDVSMQEFLCPLCECLSNTVLPLMPPVYTHQGNDNDTGIIYEDWITAIKLAFTKKREHSIADKICTEESGTTNSLLESEIVNSESSLIPWQHICHDSIEEVVSELGSNNDGIRALFLPKIKTIELSQSLLSVITHFIDTIYLKGGADILNLSKIEQISLAWKSCAYTIHSIEMVLRDSDKSVLGDLSSRQCYSIQGLVRLCAVLASTSTTVGCISKYAIKSLSALFEPDKSILEWDSFGILVTLTFALPSLFCNPNQIRIPSGGIQDAHILKLVYIAFVVKAIITLGNDFATSANMELDEVEKSTDTSRIVQISKLVQKSIRCNNFKVLDEDTVTSKVKELSINFLRCCTLFYYFLTDISPPAVLTETSGDFDSLCNYLGLEKDFNLLLQGDLVDELTVMWSQHKDIPNFLQRITSANITLPPFPLCEIPDDYSELINTTSSFRCVMNEHCDARNPTMCMVCGAVLCSQSYCGRQELHKIAVGACTYHAYTCGSGVCVFIRLRECEILLLSSSNRGCFVPPPYLDEYGETDQGLRRGNPLKLSKERFKRLNQLWMGHAVYEEIARSMETSNSLLHTQWHHL